MEEFAMVLEGAVVLSSICGFLCSIALLILLFRIPNVSATDSRDPDNDGGSLQDEQNLDANWTVTCLLILAALHAIIIPWSIMLIKPLGQMIYISYPVFEIIWFSLFRKILYAKKFRVTPFFRPAEIICIIDLIPLTIAAVLSIPVSLLSLYLFTV
jgi:hypothetical protein